MSCAGSICDYDFDHGCPAPDEDSGEEEDEQKSGVWYYYYDKSMGLCLPAVYYPCHEIEGKRNLVRMAKAVNRFSTKFECDNHCSSECL